MDIVYINSFFKLSTNSLSFSFSSCSVRSFVVNSVSSDCKISSKIRFLLKLQVQTKYSEFSLKNYKLKAYPKSLVRAKLHFLSFSGHLSTLHRLVVIWFQFESSFITIKSEMSNWSKNLGNSHSHLNLKRIAIRNPHSGLNFQNSIPIRIPESIQFSIKFLFFYVKRYTC